MTFQRWVYRSAARDEGFTLIEILVALAILGMSLAVLLGAFTMALDRTKEAQHRLNAVNLAQSILLQVETIPSVSVKNADGTTKAGFDWHIRIRDFGDTADRDNWSQRPVRVSVKIGWKDRGRNKSITLMTLRLLPKEVSS